ncbi:hypothetical protein [Herpetosiphon geysericola]|uniref:Uncharacterized protein n=1 Tax=Herpetosiphon geysericola TaxID=70996 RepID=A0A0P6YJL2_9CHLR|nr:hypothetical protein [Herpetosiphon geysericola]KPL90780.1 hypothetical protein SE18_05280 [Herpetosiphon geysericola]
MNLRDRALAAYTAYLDDSHATEFDRIQETQTSLETAIASLSSSFLNECSIQRMANMAIIEPAPFNGAISIALLPSTHLTGLQSVGVIAPYMVNGEKTNANPSDISLTMLENYLLIQIGWWIMYDEQKK